MNVLINRRLPAIVCFVSASLALQCLEYVTVLQPFRTAAMGNLAAMQDMTEPVYRTKGLAELKELITMFHKQKESFQEIPRVQVCSSICKLAGV